MFVGVLKGMSGHIHPYLWLQNWNTFDKKSGHLQSQNKIRYF